MDWNLLFNTETYTVTELVLCGIGGAMWAALYLIMIFKVRKHKYIEMPYFIAAANISWEFLWAWVFNDRIDLGSFYVILYRAWFFLDIIIFYYVFIYGYKQCHNEHIRKNFKMILMAAVVMWTGLIYSFVISDFDYPLGVNSAYMLNLGISILYIVLFMHQYQSGIFLKSIAWLKMLGSGLITIAFWTMMPEGEVFEHFAGPMVFVIDCFYIWMIYNWKYPQLDPPFEGAVNLPSQKV